MPGEVQVSVFTNFEGWLIGTIPAPSPPPLTPLPGFVTVRRRSQRSSGHTSTVRAISSSKTASTRYSPHTYSMSCRKRARRSVYTRTSTSTWWRDRVSPRDRPQTEAAMTVLRPPPMVTGCC